MTIKPIRFLMVGGFLGAGKTTAIGRLAAHYVAQGKHVAIVTNDQAYDLVDTHTLRAQGFQVGEVPGACFCCKFDDLVETVDALSGEQVPDVVIAEPVGSCTDLAATVIAPMRELFGDRFEMGPLIVLLKPSHGHKILSADQREGGKGFSPKAEYIFLKQLEEADAIVVNKIDKMTTERREELLDLVEQRFPNIPAFGVSANTGDNFEQLITAADMLSPSDRPSMEVDYQIYAQGEAELGWMNCQLSAQSDSKFELDQLVLLLVERLGDHWKQANCEIAHLKILGQTLHDSAVANLVGSDEQAELSLASQIKTSAAELLVNARVAADPQLLETGLRKIAEQLSSELGISLEVQKMQRFRPSKPVPTHRM